MSLLNHTVIKEEARDADLFTELMKEIISSQKNHSITNYEKTGSWIVKSSNSKDASHLKRGLSILSLFLSGVVVWFDIEFTSTPDQYRTIERKPIFLTGPSNWIKMTRSESSRSKEIDRTQTIAVQNNDLDKSGFLDF